MHDAPPLGGHGWLGRLLWVARRAANNNLPPAMAPQFPREEEGDEWREVVMWSFFASYGFPFVAEAICA